MELSTFTFGLGDLHGFFRKNKRNRVKLLEGQDSQKQSLK